jgi:signal transduction histidine kinase
VNTVQELQCQLDAARAELHDFTYTVSHDLRAPLRHINAFAQVIAEDWPTMPTEVAEHLATICQSAQLLASQLDGLTQLSRLGLQPLSMQAVDVLALAQDVADGLTLQHPTQALQWQLAQDVPKVRADATLLRQLLTHIMGNAVKFSRSRVPARVSLTWHTPAGAGDGETIGGSDAQTGAGGGGCQICITDNGIGFVPEQADKLFKVFAKLHPARDFPGLGLGLVSSRKIVERLGGGIDITAQLDGGCRVMFTLPIA